MKKHAERIVVLLAEDEKEGIKRIADKNNMPVSLYVRLQLLKILDREDDDEKK